MSETVLAKDCKPGQWYESDQGERWLCVNGNRMARQHLSTIVALNALVPMKHLPHCTGWDWQPPYAALHDACGLKAGDFVTVVAKTEPQGWRARWVDDMDDYIGKTYEIERECGRAGFQIDTYTFPRTSLEKVKPVYDELHASCGLKVGDRVRITAETHPAGWREIWGAFHTKAIGVVGVIYAESRSDEHDGPRGFAVEWKTKVGTTLIPTGTSVGAWFPCTSLSKVAPDYRPFAGATEFRNELQKRVTMLHGFYRCKDDSEDVHRSVGRFNDTSVDGAPWDHAFKNLVWCDGTPFGVEVFEKAT